MMVTTDLASHALNGTKMAYSPAEAIYQAEIAQTPSYEKPEQFNALSLAVVWTFRLSLLTSLPLLGLGALCKSLFECSGVFRCLVNSALKSVRSA